MDPATLLAAIRAPVREDLAAVDHAIRAELASDVVLVNSIAEKLGVPLELGGLTQQIFRRARGLYGSEAQSPEVVRMIEAACGLELRAPGYPDELVAE